MKYMLSKTMLIELNSNKYKIIYSQTSAYITRSRK